MNGWYVKARTRGFEERAMMMIYFIHSISQSLIVPITQREE
jgi:hypothetical protein